MLPRRSRRKFPMPASCAGASPTPRSGLEIRQLASWMRTCSTESVQEQESSNEDAKRNPEMDIGSDGAKQHAEAIERHHGLKFRLVILECHLREGSTRSQSRQGGRGLWLIQGRLSLSKCVSAFSNWVSSGKMRLPLCRINRADFISPRTTYTPARDLKMVASASGKKRTTHSKC